MNGAGTRSLMVDGVLPGRAYPKRQKLAENSCAVAASMDAEVAGNARSRVFRVHLFVNEVNSARSDMAH